MRIPVGGGPCGTEKVGIDPRYRVRGRLGGVEAIRLSLDEKRLSRVTVADCPECVRDVRAHEGNPVAESSAKLGGCLLRAEPAEGSRRACADLCGWISQEGDEHRRVRAAAEQADQLDDELLQICVIVCFREQ
jgi:hypothetical protein